MRKNDVLVLTGDISHVPPQIQKPTWSSYRDYDQTAAAITRATMFDTIYENGYYFMPAHYAIGQILACDHCGGDTGYVYHALTVDELSSLYERND